MKTSNNHPRIKTYIIISITTLLVITAFILNSIKNKKNYFYVSDGLSVTILESPRYPKLAKYLMGDFNYRRYSSKGSISTIKHPHCSKSMRNIIMPDISDRIPENVDIFDWAPSTEILEQRIMKLSPHLDRFMSYLCGDKLIKADFEDYKKNNSGKNEDRVKAGFIAKRYVSYNAFTKLKDVDSQMYKLK